LGCHFMPFARAFVERYRDLLYNFHVMKKDNFVYKNRYQILLALLLLMLCVIPLLLLPATKAHDNLFHLQRIDAIREEIIMGNWFGKIYTSTLDGNGYASPLFYGDILLYIPAVMVAFFGVSLLNAMKAFMIMIVVLSAISMYVCTKKITGSDRAAFVGAVLFSLGSYMSSDILQRCALGEAQAFIFLPIVFYGFWQIMYGDKGKWYWLPAGLAQMIFCHTLSSVMTVLVLALLLLFCFGQIKKEPKRLLYFVVSAIVFLVLTADFIFPMLEQMGSATFLSTDGFATMKWGSLSERSLPFWGVFSDFNFATAACKKQWIPNGLGLAPVLLLVVWFIYRKEIKDKLLVKCFILSGVFLFIATNLFPWGALQNVAGLVQFPWRFLMFPTFFIALAAAFIFRHDKKEKYFKGFMIAVVALSLCSFIINGVANYHRHFTNGKTETEILQLSENNIGAGEYLPTTDEFERDSKYNDNYQAALIENADKVFSDGELVTKLLRKDGKVIVTFSNNQKEDTYLDVPLVMYKGYSAVMEDGTELECDYGMLNRIRVELPDVESGVVTFEYTGTKVQKMSRVINMFGTYGLMAYVIFDESKRKKQ